MKYQAVILDMDGTLIEPLLDFAQIRADLDIASNVDILEGLDAMSPEARRAGHARLLAHELQAAREAKLLDGAVDIMATTRRAHLPTALLTRNTRRAAEIVLRRFPALQFDHVRCREDGIIKPEPNGVLACCKALEAEPAATLCVGDFEYDMIAANAAGAVSVAVVPGSKPAWADEADHVVTSLSDVTGLLNIE
ncbi:MAG: HAD-IA family hydrolase [Planctomycetes bacterium]|jgi:HAD superfamily hydrolase (TIGR01509 family)|nr:HAD family hydrolase [Phycisphaerae bacterium]NBB95999.1 HAD-IA family hydrolase [Planctomycetota bacterium]